MKIDPVWLVAPSPKAPSIPTRRAFVLGAACFAAGVTVGGACGYSYGASRSSDSTSAGATGGAGAEPDLPKSGDIELDQLRWLAVKAPLDELFEKALFFLSTRVKTYKMDSILWRGVERMVEEIVNNRARRVEPGVIGVIITQVNGTARPEEPSLRERVPALRERLAQERSRK